MTAKIYPRTIRVYFPEHESVLPVSLSTPQDEIKCGNQECCSIVPFQSDDEAIIWNYCLACSTFWPGNEGDRCPSCLRPVGRTYLCDSCRIMAHEVTGGEGRTPVYPPNAAARLDESGRLIGDCPGCGNPSHPDISVIQHKCLTAENLTFLTERSACPFCRKLLKPVESVPQPVTSMTPPQVTVPCPHCGTANSLGATLCVTCGKPLKEEAPPPPPQASTQQLTRPCPSCGTANSGVAQFCLRCGKPLQAGPDPKPPLPIPPNSHFLLYLLGAAGTVLVLAVVVLAVFFGHLAENSKPIHPTGGPTLTGGVPYHPAVVTQSRVAGSGQKANKNSDSAIRLLPPVLPPPKPLGPSPQELSELNRALQGSVSAVMNSNHALQSNDVDRLKTALSQVQSAIQSFNALPHRLSSPSVQRALTDLYASSNALSTKIQSVQSTGAVFQQQLELAQSYFNQNKLSEARAQVKALLAETGVPSSIQMQARTLLAEIDKAIWKRMSISPAGPAETRPVSH